MKKYKKKFLEYKKIPENFFFENGGNDRLSRFFPEKFFSRYCPPWAKPKNPLYKGGYGKGGGVCLPPTIALCPHTPFNTFGGSQFAITFTAPTFVPYLGAFIYHPIK